MTTHPVPLKRRRNIRLLLPPMAVNIWQRSLSPLARYRTGGFTARTRQAPDKVPTSDISHASQSTSDISDRSPTDTPSYTSMRPLAPKICPRRPSDVLRPSYNIGKRHGTDRPLTFGRDCRPVTTHQSAMTAGHWLGIGPTPVQCQCHVDEPLQWSMQSSSSRNGWGRVGGRGRWQNWRLRLLVEHFFLGRLPYPAAPV